MATGGSALVSAFSAVCGLAPVGSGSGSVMAALAVVVGARASTSSVRPSLFNVARRNVQVSAKNTWQDNGEGRDRHASTDADELSEFSDSAAASMHVMQNWNVGRSTGGSMSRRDAHALRQVREEFAALEFIKPAVIDQENGLGLQYVVCMAAAGKKETSGALSQSELMISSVVGALDETSRLVSSKRIAASLKHFALFARASGGGLTCVEPLRQLAFSSALMQEARSLHLPTCADLSMAEWERADSKAQSQLLSNADHIILRHSDGVLSQAEPFSSEEVQRRSQSMMAN